MAEQSAANAVLPSPAWNSAAGICDVRPSAPAADAEQGLHRALIIERVHRYGWALDEKRDDLLADCFSPGGIWEGTVMGGPMIGPVIGRDEIVSWLSGLSVDQDDQRRHSFSNLVVEFLSPTTAVAHAYVLLLIS
ncbi:nuclear transport factor 2 family protein, partial [Rhodococcus qingshengii]|uniref:nuclear transport factor 2 family protein n=1 Tax=Rhodococcus qingshengii TaxID=334542 RepID=UPI001BE64025